VSAYQTVDVDGGKLLQTYDHPYYGALTTDDGQIKYSSEPRLLTAVFCNPHKLALIWKSSLLLKITVIDTQYISLSKLDDTPPNAMASRRNETSPSGLNIEHTKRRQIRSITTPSSCSIPSPSSWRHGILVAASVRPIETVKRRHSIIGTESSSAPSPRASSDR
jgi:hypothetical protein